MAEEYGDKTEEASPRKQQEAREHGDVARSPDLTSATLLIGTMFLLNAFGGRILVAMSGVLRYMLGEASLAEVDAKSATDGLAAWVLSVGTSMLPLLAGIVFIAVAVNVAQVGFRLTPSKLALNFGALNPIKGLGQLFQTQGPMKLVMGVLKMALVALTAYSAIHSRLNQIIGIERMDFMQMFRLGAQVMYQIGLRVGLLLFALSLIDYLWKRHQMQQSLRMTKPEARQELKLHEGDPRLKFRRRQLAQQRLKKKLEKEIPEADAVITNPTEYAVALKYDADTMHAPRVIAKGQGLIAKRIRELAIAAGVPILERKPLARALYKLVEVGQEIPEEFYATVAEILAYVYELTGKVRRRNSQ